MVGRALKRRIEEIYARIPPPPPPLSELPIEGWVREFMKQHTPTHRCQYDEDFYDWHEELGQRLCADLRRRIAEAWGLEWLTAKLPLDEDDLKKI